MHYVTFIMEAIKLHYIQPTRKHAFHVENCDMDIKVYSQNKLMI